MQSCISFLFVAHRVKFLQKFLWISVTSNSKEYQFHINVSLFWFNIFNFAINLSFFVLNVKLLNMIFILIFLLFQKYTFHDCYWNILAVLHQFWFKISVVYLISVLKNSEFNAFGTVQPYFMNCWYLQFNPDLIR